jgi:hypothetical protein
LECHLLWLGGCRLGLPHSSTTKDRQQQQENKALLQCFHPDAYAPHELLLKLPLLASTLVPTAMKPVLSENGFGRQSPACG